MDKIDTYSLDKIICPYCGHEEEVDFETFFSTDLECEEEFTCGECGKEFIATRGAILIYETFAKKEEDNGED